MTKYRPGAGRLLQDRRRRRDDRRPVRHLSVVHLLQQEAVRRGQAALSADQGRRPVRRQAVGHGSRPAAGHEAHRRQERQRRHERRLRPQRTSSSGASTCSGPTTAPTAEATLFGASSVVADDGKTAQITDQFKTGSKWFNDGVWKDHFIPTLSADPERPAGQGQPVPVGQPGHGRDPQLVHVLHQPGPAGQGQLHAGASRSPRPTTA